MLSDAVSSHFSPIGLGVGIVRLKRYSLDPITRKTNNPVVQRYTFKISGATIATRTISVTHLSYRNPATLIIIFFF